MTSKTTNRTGCTDKVRIIYDKESSSDNSEERTKKKIREIEEEKILV